MKKENIIIVDPFSAGVNYIHDIRELGHNPICLEMYHKEEETRDELRIIRDAIYLLNGGEPPQVLSADVDYEKTLEMVRELNPIAIVPGSDGGIIWASKLAHDLGLPGNDPKNLKKMIDKQYMQEALKDANIRYIKSEFISSYEEAKKFVSKLDKPHVVIKPSVGQGTIGVCICKNDEELKDALKLNEDISFEIEPGEETKLIIQEYIGGEEYVINSICCKGHNRVNSASHYKKDVMEGRGARYDYEYVIDERDPEFKELEEYNDKVLKALGVDYGSTHGEYKMDENGPVLIEMNCRVPGPIKRYTLLDDVWGEHSSALSLESYLNPEECIKKSNKPLRYLKHFIIKDIIIYEDIDTLRPTFEEAFGNIESVADWISIFPEEHYYPKSIDLLTAGGYVFLVNSDKTKIYEDLNEIRRMEKYDIGKIFELR